MPETVREARTQACSVVAVRMPTVPLAGLRRAASWKRRTEDAVAGPKLPSASVGIRTSVSQTCNRCTSRPVSTSRTTTAQSGPSHAASQPSGENATHQI